jgi:hypothetical protein
MRVSIISNLAACMVALSLVGCGGSNKLKITVPTPAQVSEFVANAKITLPAAAQATGYQELRSMDDALWLQIRMPVTDLQTFLDSSPFRQATLTTNDQYRVSQFSDFLPVPPVRYRAGQESLPNARVLNMVIDESDSTNVVVYLMWHET